MPAADFDRLNEQVAGTGRKRSEILRMAWNDKPITLRHEPALDEHYKQLGKLGTNLNQLLSLAHSQLAPPAQVQHVLTQVGQKMAEINGLGNG